MRWLAVLLIWVLCLGLPLAFISWKPTRGAGTPAISVPSAPGDWAVQWESSVALAADPFAMDEEAALRISLDGQRWQWSQWAAHQRGEQALPTLRLRPQRITLHALPKTGQQAGALRVRLLRDDEVMAEDAWWIESGKPLSVSWEVDIARLERQRGR